jgi:hypothetical protein
MAAVERDKILLKLEAGSRARAVGSKPRAPLGTDTGILPQ